MPITGNGREPYFIGCNYFSTSCPAYRYLQRLQFFWSDLCVLRPSGPKSRDRPSSLDQFRAWFIANFLPPCRLLRSDPSLTPYSYQGFRGGEIGRCPRIMSRTSMGWSRHNTGDCGGKIIRSVRVSYSDRFCGQELTWPPESERGFHGGHLGAEYKSGKLLKLLDLD